MRLTFLLTFLLAPTSTTRAACIHDTRARTSGRPSSSEALLNDLGHHPKHRINPVMHLRFLYIITCTTRGRRFRGNGKTPTCQRSDVASHTTCAQVDSIAGKVSRSFWMGTHRAAVPSVIVAL
jgi:hypothetical protein